MQQRSPVYQRPGVLRSSLVNGYLSQALEQLWPASRFVIVSPSMGGRFSLPFVARQPDRVAGYVPVAPVGINDHRAALERVDVPRWWGGEKTIRSFRCRRRAC